MTPELDTAGAELVSSALDDTGVDDLRQLLPSVSGPGARIYGSASLGAWLRDSFIRKVVSGVLCDSARAVRAILFDKTPESNWMLGWHQDRTIAVRERIETPGFAQWNNKAGAIHVEPPFGIIERMLTVRIHLDPVPEDNAPLLVAPGSHRMGRITEDGIEDVVKQCGKFACVAAAGDVWLYRTPILHASDRARKGSRRRVLQVDYSVENLPGGLEWLGVG